MSPGSRRPRDPVQLRGLGEGRRAAQAGPQGGVPGEAEARRLHELQVHQIQLEKQNAELRDGQAKLTAWLEHQADLDEFAPVGYLSLNPNGVINRANLMAAGLLGVERSRLLGQSFTGLLSPESRPVYATLMADRFAGKASGYCELSLRQGRVTPMWIRLDASAPAAGHGGQLAFIDITETRKAQEALKESQGHLEQLVAERTKDLETRNAEYEGLYNHAPCGYHSLDAKGTIVAINDTQLAMLGYTREEVVGRMNIRQMISEALLPKYEKDFREFLRTGHCRDLESVFRRKDRSEFPVLVSADAKLDAQGAFLFTFSTLVDNTLHKQVEMAQQQARGELERQVVERTQLVRRLAVEATLAEERERRAIAHDLHDDLGQVLHVAMFKLDALAKAPSLARLQTLAPELKAILANASRTVRTLTTQLNPPVLETLGLVTALIWLSEEMEQTYGLSLELVDDGRPKPVGPALSAFLFRAVRELVINVAKHAAVKAAVVHTSVQDQHLVIRVEDQGPGIENLSRVLGKTKGFGLRNIRERILQLGGELSATSGAGRGLIMTLRLPLGPGDARDIP